MAEVSADTGVAMVRFHLYLPSLVSSVAECLLGKKAA